MALSADTQRVYQLIIDAGGSKAGADEFKRACDVITAASAKAAEAGKPIVDNVGAAEKAYARLVTRIDPVAVAEQRLARETQIVTDAYRAQTITIEEAAKRIGQIDARYNTAIAAARRLQGANATAATSAGRFGMAFQQAGYQIGDFAVQVASGQSPMRAFIQQSNQMLGFFGPFGIAAGTAIAVAGALAGEFLDLSTASEKAADSQQRFNDAIKDANDALDALAPKFEASEKAKTYAAIGKATEELREQEALLRQMAPVSGRGGKFADPGYGEQIKRVAELREQIEELNARVREIGHLSSPGKAFVGDDDTVEKAKAIRDIGADAITQMKEQIALFGDLSNEERALYDVSLGRYKDESQAEKDKIVQLARILDLNKEMADAAKAAADARSEANRREIAEYDQIIDQLTRAQEQRQRKAESDGESVTKSVMTDLEQYNAEMERLNELYQTGHISAETYGRAVAKLGQNYQQASAGMQLASQLLQETGQQLSSAFADAIVEGKNLNDMLNDILKSIEKMALQKGLELLIQVGIDALGSMFGGGGMAGSGLSFGGGMGASIFHGGGTVGRGGQSRAVHPGVFANAPRMHGGGTVGLGPRERPIIAEDGETIRTLAQETALQEMLARPAANINSPKIVVQNIDQRKNGEPVETTQERGPNNELIIKNLIRDVVDGDMSQGRYDKTMARRFNLSAQPATRRG